jgi:hypothetical protein
MLTSAFGILVNDISNSNNTLKCVQSMFEKEKIVVSNVKIITFVFLISVRETLVSMTLIFYIKYFGLIATQL